MILDFSTHTFPIFTKEDYIEPWQHAICSFIEEYQNSSEISVTTSGSTGKPKTISIPKKFMKNSAFMTGDYFQLQRGDTALLCLSVHYIAGKMMVVRAIELGLKLYCVSPSGNPLETIQASIDFCAMVPLQVEKSLAKLHVVKQLIIGGAPVSSTLEDSLQRKSTQCFATYGMTETVTHVAVKRLNQEKKSTYYTVLKGVTIEKDSRNCLVIHCPLLSDEVVITNDVINLVGEKQFLFLGRYDNVINSGGVKIHPETVEKKLSSIISERFFITSIPDERLGEQVVLVVETEQKKCMLDFKSVLDRFEIPKHIFTLKEFIETPTGKINRSKTLQQLSL